MATSGQYDNPIPYSYYPESLIELFPLIRDIYQDTAIHRCSMFLAITTISRSTPWA
jgi:hypothetical protein